MNSMQLLEAVGYLDEDLLERSEKKTVRNRRWIGWVAMAACICLVFVGAWGFLSPSKASDSAMENGMPSPEDPADDMLILDSESDREESYVVNSYSSGLTDYVTSGDGRVAVWYLSTDGVESLQYPDAFIIKDRQSLEEYYAANKEYLKDSDFEAVTSRYYDVFFETKQLIVLTLRESSGSVTHRVTDAYWDEGTAQWEVFLQRWEPLEKADDVAYWHILVEVESVTDDETIQLHQITGREVSQEKWSFHE